MRKKKRWNKLAILLAAMLAFSTVSTPAFAEPADSVLAEETVSGEEEEEAVTAMEEEAASAEEEEEETAAAAEEKEETAAAEKEEETAAAAEEEEIVEEIKEEIIASPEKVSETEIKVTISPKGISVKRPSETSFTAVVEGTNNTEVTWTLNGRESAGTSFSGGILYVALSETAEWLELRATSVADPTKYDVAAIRVLPPDYVQNVTITLDDLDLLPSVTGKEASEQILASLEDHRNDQYDTQGVYLNIPYCALVKKIDPSAGSWMNLKDSEEYLNSTDEYYLHINIENAYGWYFDVDNLPFVTVNGQQPEIVKWYSQSMTGSVDVYKKLRLYNEYCMNATISQDLLAWEAYPDTANYICEIGTDEEGYKIIALNYDAYRNLNLFVECTLAGYSRGIYKVFLYAIDYYNNMISYKWEGSYNYQPSSSAVAVVIFDIGDDIAGQGGEVEYAPFFLTRKDNTYYNVLSDTGNRYLEGADGKVFESWYYDPEFIEEVAPGDTVGRNTTIYARWLNTLDEVSLTVPDIYTGRSAGNYDYNSISVPDSAGYMAADRQWTVRSGDSFTDFSGNFQTGQTYYLKVNLYSSDSEYGFPYVYSTGTCDFRCIVNGSVKSCVIEAEDYAGAVIYVPFEPNAPMINGKVEFADGAVQYKGSTAYVIYNKKAQTPAVIVKNKDTGAVIASGLYTVSYKNNTSPGTGRVTITFKNGYTGTASARFKIYLPGTTSTGIENDSNGITLTWAPVDGAKGYVIYRRAWNLVSAGWTAFERWNNTTGTAWTDTRVYAGTRYQYGVKAYYADPMDNYNLGMVGPLKTTVRITTRQLNSVAAAGGKMTIKWSPSKVFTGYQVKYATNAAFTQNVKAVKVTNPSQSQLSVGSLLSGKTYYVTIRSYQDFEGMTYFGQWSDTLNCKVP